MVHSSLPVIICYFYKCKIKDWDSLDIATWGWAEMSCMHDSIMSGDRGIMWWPPEQLGDGQVTAGNIPSGRLLYPPEQDTNLP